MAVPVTFAGGDIAYAATYSQSLGEHKLLEVDPELLAYVERGGR